MPKRTLEGTVVSTKAAKTAVVLVERAMQHPLYRKTIRKSKKYHAHDAEGVCREGDRVVIQECTPMSKLKRFALVSVKEKAVQEAK